MSRLKSHAVKRSATVRATTKKHESEIVQNFMAGNSYKLNPILTAKIVTASGIFGEPSYYRNGLEDKATLARRTSLYRAPKESTADVMTAAIDAALDYDFKETLELARELRTEYNMRLNPAVIFIRAAQHGNRGAFNAANPEFMRQVGRDIILRPDDITNQFEYYMFLNTTKAKLPGLVKRVWADKLSGFNRYQLAKYQSKSLRDLIRISHANSALIDELMQLQSGTLSLEDEDSTWERLRSQGKTWKEIYQTLNRFPHMALLRNLRNIFGEINDTKLAKEILEQLKSGVKYGKQFPYRYWTAHQFVGQATINHKAMVLDTLEECIDEAMANFPKLAGKTICLSDNSGSAWGAFPSEYGTVKVAEIDNLSSVMTAYNSDEGYVGVFGDKLEIIPVSKRNGILTQAANANKVGPKQGGGTENGIWIFFDRAISGREHYDNIFIYSDQQAGHGGLYGINPRQYSKYIHGARSGAYIDVLKLAAEYRATVNPKVNIYSVQTAGYDNSVLPENEYRTAILTGWTGKEIVYADRLNKVWDAADNNQQ